MLIVIILGKKEILPRNIYIALNGIILTVGIIIIGKKIIDLSNRDNMNFDEYDWYFDKSKAPSDTGGSGSATSQPTDPWATTTSECVGEMCCTDGMYYDTTTEKCEIGVNPNPTTTTTTDPVTGITTTTTTSDDSNSDNSSDGSSSGDSTTQRAGRVVEEDTTVDAVQYFKQVAQQQRGTACRPLLTGTSNGH